MDYLKKVLVVTRVDFCENIVCSGCEVAIHDFGNLEESLNDLVVFGGVAEYKPDVCASLIAYGVWVNLCFETFDYTRSGQFLYALMDGGTGDVGFARYFEKWLSGIVGKHLKDS